MGLDTQFTEHKITLVQDESDGWAIEFDGGFSILCGRERCTEPPRVGETARLYGKGFGYPVRGIVIEGRVYRYLTEAEEEQEHTRGIRAQQEERQRELDATQPERDRRVAALPEAFQRRIERLQRATPHWRRDHEGYELFVCEEAQKVIAYVWRLTSRERALNALAVQNAVKDFYDSPDKQKAAGISDEHSGNTFGMACRLASDFLNDFDKTPTRVERGHGALCALVGCKDYGCWAAYPEA